MKETPERKPLSWEPQLRGEVYCSSACGGGCTKAAHDEAERRATELAKRMGEGWKPRVWENLGWHYAVISPCGRLKIHPSIGDRYLAFLGEADSYGGRWAEHGDTPEEAARSAIAHAKLEAANIQALVEGL
jgi:hypothetical protein